MSALTPIPLRVHAECAHRQCGDVVGRATGAGGRQNDDVADLPETRYARSGDIHVAYQVVGDGPVDLVFVPGMFNHLDLIWEEEGGRLVASFRGWLPSAG